MNDINFSGITDQKTREEIKKSQAEIADIEEEINGKLTENVNARTNILNIIKEQNNESQQSANLENRLLGKSAKGIKATDIADKSAGIEKKPDQKLTLAQQTQIEREKKFNDLSVSLTKDAADRKKQSEQGYTKFISAEGIMRLNAISGVFGAATAIAKQGSADQKALGLASIALDSAVGVAGAVKAGAGLVFPANLVAIASGITAVLTGIAQAKNLLGFESGGYTGDGNAHDVAGVVHKKEVVWNAQDVSLMGGPSVVNAMRPTSGSRNSSGGGYYDGGIVAKSATSEVTQQLALINAIKNMPPGIISVKEFTKVQDRVRIKEQISRR